MIKEQLGNPARPEAPAGDISGGTPTTEAAGCHTHRKMRPHLLLLTILQLKTQQLMLD